MHIVCACMCVRVCVCVCVCVCMHVLMYHMVGNFGEVNINSMIISAMPFESHFAKFNACQNFQLLCYGTCTVMYVVHCGIHV